MRRCSIGSDGPGDVVVDERPQDEHDRVDLADVGEELVAEAFTLAGAFDEPADVDDLDRRVDDVLRLRHRGESVEPLVGHLGDADVRVLGGERVRRGERTAAGECVVQRTLARVGETDQAETFHEPSEATDGRASGHRRARDGTVRSGRGFDRRVGAMLAGLGRSIGGLGADSIAV